MGKEPALGAEKRHREEDHRQVVTGVPVAAGRTPCGLGSQAGPQEQACLWVGSLWGQGWTLARMGERALLQDGEGGLCIHSQRHPFTATGVSAGVPRSWNSDPDGRLDKYRLRRSQQSRCG